jgi:hypothetical protein
MLQKWSPWTFLVISFMSALSIGCDWSFDSKLIFGVLMVSNFIVLHIMVKTIEAENKAQKEEDER